MAESVNNAVIEIQRIFPQVSDALGLEYLNKAERDICAVLPLRWTTETLSSLVAGTRAYNLSTENVIRVWAGRYLRSSTASNSYRLIETDITKLDLRYGNWKGDPNDEPSHFTIRANSSGGLEAVLWPTPATTSSGGYPAAQFDVTTASAYIAGDSLPAILRSADVYVFRAAWRYACDRVPERKADLWDDYKKALKEEIELMNARTAYDQPGFILDYGAPGYV